MRIITVLLKTGLLNLPLRNSRYRQTYVGIRPIQEHLNVVQSVHGPIIGIGISETSPVETSMSFAFDRHRGDSGRQMDLDVWLLVNKFTHVFVYRHLRVFLLVKIGVFSLK